jgi:DNA-binding CsgD family transcriptional regulator
MSKWTKLPRAGKRNGDDSLERLSQRELQVLKLVVEGHTSSQAAIVLGLSAKSVETYRRRIMLKLELENLPALVKFAICHGITTLEHGRAGVLSKSLRRRLQAFSDTNSYRPPRSRLLREKK